MTALSDALTAAQRSALAALEKAYVAGRIEPEALVASLEAVGISDPVDTAFLLAALDVLREWGVSAPNLTERVAEAKVEPASDKQHARSLSGCAARRTIPSPTRPSRRRRHRPSSSSYRRAPTILRSGRCSSNARPRLRCDFDRTGDDPERDEREARECGSRSEGAG